MKRLRQKLIFGFVLIFCSCAVIRDEAFLYKKKKLFRKKIERKTDPMLLEEFCP